MRPYRLFSLLLLCVGLGPGYSPIHAQLLSEDFGTTFSTTYLGAPNWSSCLSKTSNSSTGPCAGFPDYNVYLSNNEAITADQLFIPGTGYCLSFEYSYNNGSNLPRVQIGTGGAFCFSSMTWTDLATLPQTASCDAVSYSLDAYAGQSIWIRFQASAGFTSWYIDDVLVDLGSCGGGGGGCTTTVFSDDFSDGSIGAPEWSSTSAVFTSSGTPCNGGDFRCWFSTFSSPAEAITADIDLTTATYAQFDMDYYMAAAAFTFQCAFVEISTNGGGSWTNLSVPYADPDGSCQHVTQDISAYVGNTVRIRIRRSSTTQTFYFDNVEVCSDGGPASPRMKWADNFNDNDLVLDYLGTQGDEDCPSCGPWVLGGGATLNLVPSGGWNGNTNETEAFPANMPNVYYVRLDRNEWVESPTMDLSNFESLKISFYAKSSSPGTGGGDQWSFSDRLRLQIWDGAAWQTVQSMRDDLSATWNGPDDFISAALPFNYYCFTAYRSNSSPGNYYYNSSPNVNSAWFHSTFKFRVLFEGGFSGSPFAWVDDFTFRADADGYSTMIPCGLSFWNEPAATSYGQDPGTTGNTNAEKGVELELDNSINIPPLWATEADDGDTITQIFGVGESERVVFAVISEQEINFAFPRVHFYSPSMGWQSSVMSIDNNYSGPGWRYYAVEYISCDLAGGSISPPTDQYRYYFSFEYGIEFIPVFYQLNTSGIEYGGGVTSFTETFDAPDVNSADLCGTFPVTFLHFGAEWAGRDARIDWETAQEINNAGFELQRSPDGVNFDDIARVAPLAVEGEGHAYSYLDADAADRTTEALWYRLKQLDRDGNATYTDAVRLDLHARPKGLRLEAFPNPSSGALSLVVYAPDAAAAQLQIRDALGRQVRRVPLQLTAGTQRIDLPAAGLTNGLYHLSLKAGMADVHTKWLLQR